MVEMSDYVKEFPREDLMIVDALNLAFRWKHQGSSVFAQEYKRTVESLARSYKCGKIVIAADWGGSEYRREIFPEYKANRKELYADDTPAEKAATKAFFDEYEATLELLDPVYTVFRYKGVEADDIAAYLVSRRIDYGFNTIWLISSDRDWDLLIEENVHRFSYVTRKEQTLDTWDNPVSPDQYLCYKCLIGDKGDNVPGVPGVGPKRATSLLEEYGTALDICDAIPIPGKYVYIKNLNDNRDQILMNHELMDLKTYCQEAIGQQNLLDIGRRIISG